MTDTLWMKFADDTNLPSRLNAAEQAQLTHIFDASNPKSHWNRALHNLRLRGANVPMVKWIDTTPYINWSAMVDTVTCGWTALVQGPDGQGFRYAMKGNILHFFRFLKGQWKLSQYFMRHLPLNIPDDDDDKIIESLALGLCYLMLTMRLPAHDEIMMANWLRDIDKTPPPLRRTLQQMMGIQKRRTILSAGWKKYFPTRPVQEVSDRVGYFWNDAPALPEISMPDHGTEWRGLPVSGGAVTARAIVMTRDAVIPDNEPVILIFKHARPDTVEYFPAAAGIIYAVGGVMSHACTVAREMNINCITGVGPEFFDRLRDLSAHTPVYLMMDAGTGHIELVQGRA